jgi:hypothetical protein
MIALVMAGGSWSMALTLAALVAVPYLGAYRPQTRRIVAALLVAVVLAGLAAHLSADDFTQIRNCAGLSPSDWLYWVWSCWGL